ncbi:M20 family metallopeptidase [Virgibacillus sp. JSM 102003]|uniref:M20 family metallopeptidase n=1 Tax=Virgibacillus sp. JSM 102003 TaxID=1562108 RepID=UPI0035C0374D
MIAEELKSSIVEGVDSDELLEIVKKLISIPSHLAFEKRESLVASYLHELFKSEGIDSYLQEVTDGRPNVIAKLNGTQQGSSLMLNGHIDTVPTFGMENPFSPIMREGKLYGRGSTDMKSGVGAMAYALIVLNRLGVKLQGDLVFAGVIDEEASGSAGTHYLVENGPKTDLAIVGEPTQLHPVVAHKGCDYFEVTFTGRSVHSSVPENGANAAFAGGHFMQKIEEELIPKYKNMVHPLVGAPTVNVDMIQGSSQGNMPFLMGESSGFSGIVADVCRVYIDIRWTPHQSAEGITQDIEEIAQFVKQARIGINAEVKHILPHPAMEIDPEHTLVQSVQGNIKKTLGKEKSIQGATYWGDSGLLYELANIPSLLFGPGDIGCAHSDNEYIDASHITPAAIIYALTAVDICGVK